MVLKHTTPTKKASHPIPQEAFDWYDEYAHGKISRREFLNRLGGLAVLGFSMTALVDALTPLITRLRNKFHLTILTSKQLTKPFHLQTGMEKDAAIWLCPRKRHSSHRQC